MGKITLNEVTKFVELNIGTFHQKRLTKLEGLKLNEILKRKNPYLFKAKNILTSEALVRALLDAYLSSQEEAIFGEFFEGLALFICGKVNNGRKSIGEGIDLEFDRSGVHYIVTIKSGPNWGNNSQIKKMKDHIRQAKKIFRTNSPRKNVIAVNGCCYGRDNNPEKEEYQKLCGQEFWEFISGDPNLYVEIIEPLGHKAREKNEEFMESYSVLINRFTQEFSASFCLAGKIQWEQLVKFNSSRSTKNKK